MSKLILISIDIILGWSIYVIKKDIINIMVPLFCYNVGLQILIIFK